MPATTPAALVEEFKKSGEFDRIRRELLVQFREKEEAYVALKARVEEIGKQRLAADQTLKILPNQDFVQKELMQEIQRYPIIERAVGDVRIFSDATFISNLDSSLRRTLSGRPPEVKPAPTVAPSASSDLKPLFPSPAVKSTSPSSNLPPLKDAQPNGGSPPITTIPETSQAQDVPSGEKTATADAAAKPSDALESNSAAPVDKGGDDVEMKDIGPED